jgi:CubicO group peptidase (beta-lactamase class C family)
MVIIEGLTTGVVAQESSMMERGLYYPPQSGQWEMVAPEDAGWDADGLEVVLDIAGRNNSTSMVILHRGRIIAERYWELAREDPEYTIFLVGTNAAGHPIEDLASIQKSVVSFLTAMAVERGLLDINRPVSDLLGSGWSNAEPNIENRITVRHIMTMTSGLDDELNSHTPPGEVWSYSGAYKKMIPILEAATGLNIQTLTHEWLLAPIGMNDSRWTPRHWAADIALAAPIGFAASARDAARFGLLVLAGGKWGGVQLVGESAVAELLESSQEFNPSYGLLWWLNGKNGPRNRSVMFHNI